MSFKPKKEAAAANTKPRRPRQDFGPARKGMQYAKLVGWTVYGKQKQSPYQGQERKPAAQIDLTFELPTDRIDLIVDDEGNTENKPRWISTRRVTFSSDERAILVKWIDAMDPDGEYDGDLEDMLGQMFVLKISNNQVGEKVYDRIDSISAVENDPMTGERPDLSKLNPGVLEADRMTFNFYEPTYEEWFRLSLGRRKVCQSAVDYPGSYLERVQEDWAARIKADLQARDQGKAAPEETEEAAPAAPAASLEDLY